MNNKELEEPASIKNCEIEAGSYVLLTACLVWHSTDEEISQDIIPTVTRKETL